MFNDPPPGVVTSTSVNISGVKLDTKGPSTVVVEGADLDKWIKGSLGGVKEELSIFRKSEAFKGVKDGDKRISEIDTLLDQAANAKTDSEKHEKFQAAASKMMDLRKEQEAIEQSKPIYAYPQFYPQAPPFQPFAPNLGQFSQTSPIMASLVQMAMQSMMGGGGTAMMGISDQNIMDRFRQSHYTRQAYGVAEDMAALDRPAIQQSVATMFAMTGRAFNDEAKHAIGFASQAWPQVAPIMAAMSPELTDSLFGMRGSAAAFGFGAAQAARSRFDPRSRLLGMDRESITGPDGLARSVWTEMFADNNYLSSPLSAGDAGQLWRELQAQGLMPGTSTIDDLRRSRPDAVNRAMEARGLGGRSWASLSAGERDLVAQSPDVQSEIKSFDTQKVSGTLREWGKSIEAMREIFGDAGMPNAPIPLLMQSLRQLTSGGLTQMNQGELTTMVRTFSTLAQNSNLGMQGASMLVQAGAMQASQYGLSAVFAPQASMETMAYMSAYGAAGRGQVAGWGMSDINTLAQARQQLNISGRASTVGNQIGLAYRTLEELGPFKAGSRMAMWMDALKHGNSTFAGGASVSMQDADFAEMMADATGQSADEVQMRLGQTYQNSSGLYYNPEAMRSVRALQREEMKTGVIGTTASSTMSALLGKRFGAGSAMAGLGGFLGQSFAGIVFDNNRFDIGWNAQGMQGARATGVANEMYKDLLAASKDPENPNHDAARSLLARGEQEVKAMLKDFAATTWGDAEQEARRHNVSLEDLQALHDPALDAQATRIETSAHADSVLAGVMGKAGKGGIVRRFMEGMMNGDVANLKDLSKLGLGGVDANNLRKIIAAAGFGDAGFEKLRSQFTRIRELKGQLTMGGETAAKARAELAKMNEEEGGIVDTATRWMDIANKQGIDLGATLYESGTLGAASQRLMGFVGKEGADLDKWIKGSLGGVKEELSIFRKSEAFKGVKDGDKRISEIDTLLDQAANAKTDSEKHEKFQAAASKMMDLRKEQEAIEQSKPIVVTSTSVNISGVKLDTKGPSTVVVGGGSTTPGGP